MTPSDEWLVELARAQLWQITLLIAVAGVFTATVCRRSPHLAHLLWCLVVIKCLTPPLWSSQLGIFSWLQRPVAAAAVARDPPAPRTPSDSASSGRSAASPESATTLADRHASDQRASGAAVLSRGSWTLVGAAWLAGTVVLLLVSIGRWAWCMRRLSSARVCTGVELQRRVDRLREQLGVRQRVETLVTARSLGPASFGLWRPRIVLPRALLSSLKPQGLDAVLAHELVHIRRRDHLVACLQLLAQAAWWFHPLVWWATRRLSEEAERCCDEQVVAGLNCPPGDYARSLLDVVELRLGSLPGQVAIRGSQVTRRRLETIMTSLHRHPRTPSWCWAATLAAALLVLPGAPLWSNRSAVSAERPHESPAVVEDSAATGAAAEAVDPLRGRWRVVRATWLGPQPESGDVWAFTDGQLVQHIQYTRDGSAPVYYVQQPGAYAVGEAVEAGTAIDVEEFEDRPEIGGGGPRKGFYRLDGDRLLLVVNASPVGDRPATAEETNEVVVREFRRLRSDEELRGELVTPIRRTRGVFAAPRDERSTATAEDVLRTLEVQLAEPTVRQGDEIRVEGSVQLDATRQRHSILVAVAVKDPRGVIMNSGIADVAEVAPGHWRLTAALAAPRPGKYDVELYYHGARIHSTPIRVAQF